MTIIQYLDLSNQTRFIKLYLHGLVSDLTIIRIDKQTQSSEECINETINHFSVHLPDILVWT